MASTLQLCNSPCLFFSFHPFAFTKLFDTISSFIQRSDWFVILVHSFHQGLQVQTTHVTTSPILRFASSILHSSGLCFELSNFQPTTSTWRVRQISSRITQLFSWRLRLLAQGIYVTYYKACHGTHITEGYQTSFHDQHKSRRHTLAFKDILYTTLILLPILQDTTLKHSKLHTTSPARATYKTTRHLLIKSPDDETNSIKTKVSAP